MSTQKVTDEMVSRFLCWKLPQDFAPDCGISFTPFHPNGTTQFEPVGTNLLTAVQARQMLEHVLGSNWHGLTSTKRYKELLALERTCCGTLPGSRHRATCEKRKTATPTAQPQAEPRDYGDRNPPLPSDRSLTDTTVRVGAGTPTAQPQAAEPADNAGHLINSSDVRDSTYDTPLPVFYPTAPTEPTP